MLRLAPLALAAFLAACGSTRILDRTDDGTPIVMVGAQPDEAQLRRMHDLYGVKTIVNLRGENPDERWFRNEQRGVEAIGAKWVHLRTSGLEEPPQATLDRYFELIEDRSNWPIYLHCESGMHRAGLMGALYRMQYQGWTGEQAWAEMRGQGFKISRRSRDAVVAYVKSYERDPNRTLPSAAVPQPAR